MPFTLIGSGAVTYNIAGGVGTTSYLFGQNSIRTVASGPGLLHTTGQTSNLTLSVQGDIFSDSAGVQMTRQGTTNLQIGEESQVNSVNSTGISLFSGAPLASVNVVNLGTISSWGTGFTSNSARVDFQNHGTISSLNGTGVSLNSFGEPSGDALQGVNSGLISGDSDALTIRIAEAATGSFFNSGSILSNGNDTVDAGIEVLPDGDVYITNIGTIAGQSGILRGFLYNQAAGPEINNLHVTNSGTISAMDTVDGIGVGYDALGQDTESPGGPYPDEWNDPSWSALDLTNTGLITGRVVGAERRDTIVNSGTIDGRIDLNGGNDIFDGRGGEVLGSVYGGAGNDTYTVDRGDISLIEAEDMGLDSVRSTASFELGEHIERLRLLGGDNLNGTGNDGANNLVGNAGQNRLSGQDEDDFIYGAAGADTLLGDAGDDFLSGNSGWDILRGGMGNDTLLGGAGRNVLDGGEGIDRASYSNAMMTGVRADLGDASTNTGIARGDSYSSIENLWGSNFADVLYGDDDNNQLMGSLGNDTIWGRDGDDNLDGMQDDDRISGNMGNDTLRGGGGNDTFNFWTGNGNDTITDYTDGSDQIRFFIGGLNFGGLSISNMGGNAVIDYGSGEITLTGVNAAVLDAGDFVF